MTSEQKQRITEMRLLGMGYTAIADALGIPSSTVKTFCWRNQLAIKATETASVKKSDVCLNCGVPIQQRRDCPPRKFCGDDCRFAWWRQNRDKMKHQALYHFVCAHCGRAFDSYANPNRKYCSRDCYFKHRFGEAKV